MWCGLVPITEGPSRDWSMRRVYIAKNSADEVLEKKVLSARGLVSNQTGHEWSYDSITIGDDNRLHSVRPKGVQRRVCSCCGASCHR